MRRPSLVRTAASLLTRGGPLQGAASGPIEAERIEEAIASALDRASTCDGIDLQGMPPSAIARGTLEHARCAIERIEHGASESSLGDEEFAALEVIVHVIGRPAIGFTRDKLDEVDAQLGENERWIVLISGALAQVQANARSIGRVTETSALDPAGTLGTAWVAAPGLVVTNRHVVKGLVADPSLGVGNWRLKPGARAVVDFAATRLSDGPRQFQIDALIHCAPEEDIDLAVLSLAPGAAAPPGPLELDFDEAALGLSTPAPDDDEASGREVYLVGHPYAATSSIPTELVFRKADGSKRLSPGFIKKADTGSTLLHHDCSTLGGHSGAAVLGWDHRVLGIHVGGLDATASGRGSANIAVALCRIGSHPAVRLIKEALA